MALRGDLRGLRTSRIIHAKPLSQRYGVLRRRPPIEFGLSFHQSVPAALGRSPLVLAPTGTRPVFARIAILVAACEGDENGSHTVVNDS